MDPKQVIGMPETDENNTTLNDAPPRFKIPQSIVGSPSHKLIRKLTSLTEVLGKANEFIQGEEFDKAATSKRSEEDGKEKENEKEKDKYRKDKKTIAPMVGK
uniref:Fgenesh protein 50 n=1 Tax=Beta vulgaris TaxID=161934 RepID=Q1ZY21_BETVU|nr:Fgenesh protein 50 [Beta vulgaris]